jgi:hypothetical protein
MIILAALARLFQGVHVLVTLYDRYPRPMLGTQASSALHRYPIASYAIVSVNIDRYIEHINLLWLMH